jgi:hypothetical protein
MLHFFTVLQYARAQCYIFYNFITFKLRSTTEQMPALVYATYVLLDGIRSHHPSMGPNIVSTGKNTFKKFFEAFIFSNTHNDNAN